MYGNQQIFTIGFSMDPAIKAGEVQDVVIRGSSQKGDEGSDKLAVIHVDTQCDCKCVIEGDTAFEFKVG